MDEFFSIPFLSIIATISLENGIVGGLIGLGIGWIGKEKTLRWFVTYALIGIFWAYSFSFLVGTSKQIFQAQFNIFLPLFAFIGFVWSGYFKYRYKDFDWRLLALFPFIGILAAILYQSRGYFWWSFVFGAISGSIIWYQASPRYRSTLVLAGVGLLIPFMLFVYGFSGTTYWLIIILGCLSGGLVGWFIQNQTMKWTILLGASAMLVGGTVNHTAYSLGLHTVIFVGIVFGFLGIIVGRSRHREMINSILFGGVFFSALITGWGSLISLESIGLV